MRLILTLILCIPLAAQLPLELMRRPTLNRSALAAAVNLTGGVDTQSIASLPPGTATLVRGANTGASTDDPTVSLAGWAFDNGDRVSGLPAKGAAWTTTNCSGVECYTVTSGGQEYINGVARRNLLRWSEDFSRTGSNGWSVVAATRTANTVVFQSASDSFIFGYHPAIIQGNQYTVSVYASSTDLSTFRFIYYSDGSGGYKRSSDISITASEGRYSYTFTAPSQPTTFWVGISNGSNNAAGTLSIRGIQLEAGPTANEYQKTTDSREWALETPGNYVGLLTWWGRWDRVLNPGEVLNNYRAWLKPRLNATAGVSLP